jgi:NAD(P)-dependent dehydrogenase (short-subunit alcohol dehydrogenase family)
MKIIATTAASDGIGAEMARQFASAHGNGLKEEGAMSVEAMALTALKHSVKPA